MVGKILLAIVLGILFLAGVAFIGLIIAIFTLTAGNRSIVIDAEIKEDKHEEDTDNN